MTQPNAESEKLAKLEAALSGLQASRPVDVEAALRRVKTRMHPQSTWGRYAGWAAAAGIVLVAGLLWRSNAKTTDGRAASVATYTTQVGTRDSVVLADGSRIVLGPASSVTVRGREVELRGEAFFAVTHDESSPFIVRTGDAVIRDIGTEFTVHADHANEVRVVVREGSVSLSKQADSVILEKGDVGVLASNGAVTASRGAATDADMAWTTGRLVFRDAGMADVAADLRRWYGVELKVTDPALAKRHFTGSFLQSDAPGRVFDAIAAALPARVDRRGDTVYIRPAARSK